MPENHNLYARFHKIFEARLDKTLLATDNGDEWRYADVEGNAARLAGLLAQSGVKPGDRVSVQAAKSPALLCLYLACLRGGFVFHPLNPAYQAAELDYFFSDAEPAAVVCDNATVEVIGPLAKRLSIPRLFTLAQDGSGTLMELARDADADLASAYRDRHDMATLLYSSGTTGKPKGIVLTHNNLYVGARALVQAWGFTEDDILLHALPIYHIHGLFVALGCVLLSGAAMRWLPAFNTEKVVALLPDCTTMMGVPTYYTRLLGNKDFTRETAAHIRLFISGSAPLPAPTFHAFEDRTGQRILERYGMTETNMNTSNPLRGARKPGSVGLPLPGVEIRICDCAGTALPTGAIGNIQVRGENVFREYWRRPEQTQDDFTQDGFFNTGDLGVLDEDGYLSIVGRSKDLIISGGLNVYPAEVERVLNGLDGVSEATVIGIPHADFGEAVVAVLVPRPNASPQEDTIIAATKQKLAGYKAPKRVVFVDELPRNAMGKVQKNVLRREHQHLLLQQ